MARFAYQPFSQPSPPQCASFRNTLCLLGALIFVSALTLLLTGIAYTSLCYHSSPTGFLTYCSTRPLYTAESLASESAIEINQLPQQLKLLANIARYSDVCGIEGTSPKDENLNESNHDFYSLVKMETEAKDAQFNQNLDLATILLPKYSEGIPLNNISNELFLYNAFYRKPNLRIIGLALEKLYCPNESLSTRFFSFSAFSNENLHSRQLLCVFESAGHHGGSELRINATVECLPEGHKRPFTSLLIQCHVPVRARRHLKKVKIIQRDTSTRRSKVSGPIEVFDTNFEIPAVKRLQSNKEMTVCVRPLFDSINLLNLLEFIAYYQTNGITNIAIYYYDYLLGPKFNTSQTLSRSQTFLHFLASIPGVHVHPFLLPKSIESQVHAGAQIATVHDCLLRYPASVQLHLDFDEFIFLSDGKTTLHQWISTRQGQLLPNTAALYISSVLHCHEFNLKSSPYYEFQMGRCKGDEVGSQTAPNHCLERTNSLKNTFYLALNGSTVNRALIVPNNRHCQQTVWPHEIRSKVILLQANRVRHMGIHNVWKYEIEEEEEEESSSPSYSGNLLWNYILPSGSSDNSSKLSYLTHLNVPASEAVLRHYRWCCSITQSYFFELFHFYAVNDKIVQAAIPSQITEITQNTTKQTNTKLENFVLHYFQQFLKSTQKFNV